MSAVGRGPDSLRIKISGTEIVSLTAICGMPGFSIDAAAGRNGPGTGVVRYDASTRGFSYKAPGSNTFGEAVLDTAISPFVVSDGEDVNKWLRASRYDDFVPASSIERDVFLGDRFTNGMGVDVDAADALAGDVATWQLTITNSGGGGAAYNVKAWIDASVSGIEISTDGVSWYAPDAENHADVLVWASIAALASVTLHVRRTIGAATDFDPKVLNWLHFGFDAF